MSKIVFAQPPEQTSDTFECDYATDIDQDDDGLIEICNLEGLNAIRYQLGGSGYRASADAGIITAGCKLGGCNGYELVRDLDFNDHASYSSTANKVMYTVADWQDSADSGWQPIGDLSNPFNSIFTGNGHTISNLTINRPYTNYVGLFGDTGNSSKVSNIGLLNVDIDGGDNVGGLAGAGSGNIMNSYAGGSVDGNRAVGGLVGSIRSTGSITNSYAGGSVDGKQHIGGLVGFSYNIITNSYATGSVNGNFRVGGLIGSVELSNRNENSYATGSVNGIGLTGGLVGDDPNSRVTNSYWNTETSGLLRSAAGTGKTTAALQSPTMATGIYSNWNAANWDFGTSKQLPILKYNDACTTTALKGHIDQPVCGTLLPNQGTGLRTLEALTSRVVPLFPVFSGEPGEYMADTPSSMDSIDLRLRGYDAKADFEINKQGDADNWFTNTEKSTIPVSSGEILTIRVTEAAADTATAMLTVYTLQVGLLPPEISVTETAEDGTEDNNVIVQEGSSVTLEDTNDRDEAYSYEWQQTAGQTLPITGSTTASALSFEIPDNFVKSAETTTVSVTFTVTVMDDRSNAIASKTLTIKKIDNGDPIIEAGKSGSVLSVIGITDADDYDGDADNNVAVYRWQVQDGRSWMNVGENVATYTKSPRTDPALSHRVVVTYTDDQGYGKEATEVYPNTGVRIQVRVFPEGLLR